MDPKELRLRYMEVLKRMGLLEGTPVLTDEEGIIRLQGRRWILMDVEAFPHYVIEVVSKFMGERLAQEFVYWFGSAYGEKYAERYLKMGIPEDKIVQLLPAIPAVVTGWGILEVVKYSPEEGEVVVRIYNDFESESAALNGASPTNNFMRGVLAGVVSRIWGAKVYASAEYKDGYILVTARKR